MDFLSEMKAKAKADKKVIVLPESYEKRNLEAAAECLRDELADIVLIGNKEKIMEAAGSFDVSKAILREILKTTKKWTKLLLLWQKLEKAKA